MNLVSFSIKTKGVRNFTRRVWTVFTRFGFTEARSRRALRAIMDALSAHSSGPTFFIPAVVLGRHSHLITEIAGSGAEIGIHGYVHNDYRSLTKSQQLAQTRQAMDVFDRTHVPYAGFRNPYLGWTQDSLEVFATLGLAYESNEAVSHDVIDLATLSELQRGGYEKSMALFQAIPCSAYALRPRHEGTLLRLPTSIPDDEILYDRLRMTDPHEVGAVWCAVLRRVYDLGGLYALNLHPERGVLLRPALDQLLTCAADQPLPVWIARLTEVAAWWRERSRLTLAITPLEEGRWQVSASGSPRATLLARHAAIADAAADPWFGPDVRVRSASFVVEAERCPRLVLSGDSPQEVADFLHEQGYPFVRGTREMAAAHAFYLDLPQGLGAARHERLRTCADVVAKVEALDAPFVHLGCWPDGSRAALAISGDIDSITIQDFFLRIAEVRR